MRIGQISEYSLPEEGGLPPLQAMIYEELMRRPDEVFEYQGEELLRVFPKLKRSALNWSLWLLAKTSHIDKMRVRVNGKLTTVYGTPQAIEGLRHRMETEDAIQRAQDSWIQKSRDLLGIKGIDRPRRLGRENKGSGSDLQPMKASTASDASESPQCGERLALGISSLVERARGKWTGTASELARDLGVTTEADRLDQQLTKLREPLRQAGLALRRGVTPRGRLINITSTGK